jgi:hypothetical protein
VPFTAEATAVAGTALTAAFLNTNLRDNVQWLATDSPCVRAYNSAAISIPTGADTLVTLNSERFDNAAMHSTSSNTSRLTVPTGGGGKYLFGGVVDFGLNSIGGRGCHIKLNSATFIAKTVMQANADGGSSSSTVTSSYAMNAADYIDMFAYQGSGGNLNLTSTTAYSPEAWAYWLRT